MNERMKERKNESPYSSCWSTDAKTALIGVGLITIDERYGMPVLEKGMSHSNIHSNFHILKDNLPSL